MENNDNIDLFPKENTSLENDEKKSKIQEKIKNSNNKLNEKEIFGKIFFKKYKAVNKIGTGSFCSVFEGINVHSKEKVAIKIEPRKTEHPLLEDETYYLYQLKGFGIVPLITFGRNKHYNILIEPLLGKSLYYLFLENNKNFTLKDICQIAIQSLSRIQFIHSKGIIHRDIKPENFVIGRDDPRIIYLLDFGLSQKFRSDRTNKHIQYRITGSMSGTARYASMNALRGVQLSRRDDVEGMAYMILYFCMKKLPWQGVRGTTLAGRYKKIYYKKKSIEENKDFQGLPIEIQKFVKMSKKLRFDEKPNYSEMKTLFRNLMKKNEMMEDGDFSWIIDKKLFETKLSVNQNIKKNWSQIRIINSLIEKSEICNPNKHDINDIDNKKETKVECIEGINEINNNEFINKEINFNDKKEKNFELKNNIIENKIRLGEIKEEVEIDDYEDNSINETLCDKIEEYSDNESFEKKECLDKIENNLVLFDNNEEINNQKNNIRGNIKNFLDINNANINCLKNNYENSPLSYLTDLSDNLKGQKNKINKIDNNKQKNNNNEKEGETIKGRDIEMNGKGFSTRYYYHGKYQMNYGNSGNRYEKISHRDYRTKIIDEQNNNKKHRYKSQKDKNCVIF